MSLRSMDDRRIFTLRSFTAVALAAALNFSSSALVATDLRVPFSKAERICRSYTSTFAIRFTLLYVVTCRLATRNYGLEEKVVNLFNKGDQVNITIKRNDEYPLIWILRLVGVFHDIEQALGLNRDDDALKRHPANCLERFILFDTPAKRFHSRILRGCVPFVTRRGQALICQSRCWPGPQSGLSHRKLHRKGD